MRYLLMHRLEETAPEASNPPPEFLAAMGQYMADIGKAGILLTAEGVQHSRTGAKIRQAEGESIITDGPFVETREVIGGFAVVDVRSREEALEWATRYAALFEKVEVEMRLIAEFSEQPEAAQQAFHGEA